MMSKTALKQSKKMKKKSGTSKPKGSTGPRVSEIEKIKYSSPRVTKNFTVSKREFISNILGSNSFQPQRFEVNPGIPGTFPWLSGIALSFEKYKFRKLKFEFKTSQSTFLPGMVMMAPDFNVSSATPATKAEMLEYAYAVRGPVWQNFAMDMKSSDVMNYKDYYTRNGPVNDQKLYDPLFLVVATDGIVNGSGTIGELWVEYEVEFLLPQRLSNPLLTEVNFKTFKTQGITLARPTGTSILSPEGTLPILFDQTLNRFTFPEGFYGLVLNQIEQANWNFDPLVDGDSIWSLTVTNGTISPNFVGVKGSILTNGSVSSMIWVTGWNVQPGGYVTVIDPGWTPSSEEDNPMNSSGTYMFWNRSFLPAFLTPPLSGSLALPEMVGLSSVGVDVLKEEEKASSEIEKDLLNKLKLLFKK